MHYTFEGIDMVARVPTGIKGFDDLIEGGFPKGSLTLVAGTPGTGKSILCAEIAYNNAVKGKKCLYLDLEQKADQLSNQLDDFGFSQTKLKNNLKIVTLDSSDASLIENISNELSKDKFDLIVLDSIESIINSSAVMGKNKELSLDQIQESVMPTVMDTKSVGRLKLRKLFSNLSNTNATVFVIGEKVEGSQGLSRDTISEFLCDNIISINYIGMGAIDFRSLQIRKMRRSGHEKGFILFEIGPKGIKLIEDPLKKKK
ncbi:MAG: ATPase domain-containing protein [Sphaerochaetaceae bacterium]|nr:ATPase domain-containing protein [Sphaerochaetaceae bacterium]